MRSFFRSGSLIGASLLSTLLVASAWADDPAILRIWLREDRGNWAVQDAADRFAYEQGIRVIVEKPDQLPDRFVAEAGRADGPDILLWPHDQIAQWAGQGLIRESHPTAAFRDQYFAAGWQAVTYRGKTWGYPVTMDAVSLIYNRDLLRAPPPRELEKIPGLLIDDHGYAVAPMLWDVTSPYFTWPILAAGGVEVFPWTPEGWSAESTEVNAPSVVANLTAIHALIQQEVIAPTMGYVSAEARINGGSAAMMINASWGWANLRASGIDFGIAPIPSADGQPGSPFINVLVAVVAADSPEGALAEQFLRDYLLTEETLRLMDEDAPLGIPAHRALAEAMAAQDVRMADALANLQRGQVIPNIPEMQRFWQAMSLMLPAVYAGRITPQEGLDQVAKELVRPKPGLPPPLPRPATSTTGGE